MKIRTRSVILLATLLLPEIAPSVTKIAYTPITTPNTPAAENGVSQQDSQEKIPTPEESPLCLAAKNGDYTRVQQLLPTTNAKELGAVLSAAASNNHKKIILLLLQAGANPNENNGEPLQNAARTGHITCTQALLAAGADSNLKDSGDFEKTALEKATDPKMIQLLREHGARD